MYSHDVFIVIFFQLVKNRSKERLWFAGMDSFFVFFTTASHCGIKTLNRARRYITQWSCPPLCEIAASNTGDHTHYHPATLDPPLIQTSPARHHDTNLLKFARSMGPRQYNFGPTMFNSCYCLVLMLDVELPDWCWPCPQTGLTVAVQTSFCPTRSLYQVYRGSVLGKPTSNIWYLPNVLFLAVTLVSRPKEMSQQKKACPGRDTISLSIHLTYRVLCKVEIKKKSGIYCKSCCETELIQCSWMWYLRNFILDPTNVVRGFRPTFAHIPGVLCLLPGRLYLTHYFKRVLSIW